jgi:hypothetical protein
VKFTLHFENNLSHPCVERFNKNCPAALKSNRKSKIPKIQKYKVVWTTLENYLCILESSNLFFPSNGKSYNQQEELESRLNKDIFQVKMLTFP